MLAVAKASCYDLTLEGVASWPCSSMDYISSRKVMWGYVLIFLLSIARDISPVCCSEGEVFFISQTVLLISPNQKNKEAK